MTEAKRLFEEAFHAEVLDVAEEFPDARTWSAAGRGRRKNLPDGEDGAWWLANGPGMVQNWIDWRKQSGWRIWSVEGQPAIEMSQEFVTPQGRQIKGFIDRIFVHPNGGHLVIVDLKSGARSPESDLQLAFYRYCIYNTLGVDIRLGAYWMARTGEMSDIYNLNRITPALMDLYLARLDRAIEGEIFIPHISFRCRACSHRDYCLAFGGSKSHIDPDFQEVAA